MLSSSIQRQRDLSLQIGGELELQTGLLEDVESGVDRTALRLGGARRRLDRVAAGARENGSSFIFFLLFNLLLAWNKLHLDFHSKIQAPKWIKCNKILKMTSKHDK